MQHTAHIKNVDLQRLSGSDPISSPAKRALERLARHHSLTLAVMIEKQVIEERSRVIAEPDDDQFKMFVEE